MSLTSLKKPNKTKKTAFGFLSGICILFSVVACDMIPEPEGEARDNQVEAPTIEKTSAVEIVTDTELAVKKEASSKPEAEVQLKELPQEKSEPTIEPKAQSAPTFALDRCDEEFEEVDFCSPEFISQYTQAMMTESANFNQKYILQFIGESDGFQEVVAIDTEINEAGKHYVIPVGIEIKAEGEVKFSKDTDTFCFFGEVYGYRQADKASDVCYKLSKNDNHPINKSAMDFGRQ